MTEATDVEKLQIYYIIFAAKGQAKWEFSPIFELDKIIKVRTR